jgi:quinol monooxygenase YgiN
MIVIAGSLKVHPDDREALLEAFGPIQAATRADEPGCLQYAFSADPLNADSVLVFEHWADGAALEAHFVHPNFTTARTTLGGFRLQGSTIRKYHVDAEDAIGGPDGRPTATFSGS